MCPSALSVKDYAQLGTKDLFLCWDQKYLKLDLTTVMDPSVESMPPHFVWFKFLGGVPTKILYVFHNFSVFHEINVGSFNMAFRLLSDDTVQSGSWVSTFPKELMPAACPVTFQMMVSPRILKFKSWLPWKMPYLVFSCVMALYNTCRTCYWDLTKSCLSGINPCLPTWLTSI